MDVAPWCFKCMELEWIARWNKAWRQYCAVLITILILGRGPRSQKCAIFPSSEPSMYMNSAFCKEQFGYDSFSVEPIIWVRRGHESESGQMVLKNVKLTYFDAYLSQTMWNHAKKINGRVQTFRFSVFTMGLCWKRQKTQKLEKLKRKLLKILKRYDLSSVAPCESWRPEVSENVVVFDDWSF